MVRTDEKPISSNVPQFGTVPVWIGKHADSIPPGEGHLLLSDFGETFLASQQRHHIKRPALRTVPWVLLAIIYMVLLGAAGIFSSEVSKTTGKDRLIRGGLCGYSYPLDPTEDQLIYHREKTNKDAQLGLTYSKSCYHGSHDPLYCQAFVKGEIQYTSNQNATCPFGGDICEYSNTAAYELDAGQLDSHEAFGINSLSHDRLTIRMRSTCEPLKN